MSNQSSHIASRRGKLKKSGAVDYIQRREEIIAIAAKVFKEKGYHSAKLSDISETAGVDRASLYYYVSGKEELFHEIIYKATLLNVDMVEAIANSSKDAIEKVREFICGIMVAYCDQYPHMFVYLQEDMQTITKGSDKSSEEMRKLSKRFDSSLIKIIQQGLDEGSIRPVSEARLIAFGIIGMVNWSHRWFLPDQGYSAEKVGNDFAEIVVSGLVNTAFKQ